MEINSVNYEWGEVCNSVFSIGLRVETRELASNMPIRWRWAIRNLSAMEQTVTVQYDEDVKSRYRLQIFKSGKEDSDPAEKEFFELLGSPLSQTTRIRPPVKIKLNGNSFHEFEMIDSMQNLSSGMYSARVLFGGPPFNFKCVSGIVKIRIAN